MQYGNEQHRTTIKIDTFRFKSYYVVWKHNNKYIPGGSCYVFKSYYVVWKPWQHMIELQKILLFKSYYVVWKRKKQMKIK